MQAHDIKTSSLRDMFNTYKSIAGVCIIDVVELKSHSPNSSVLIRDKNILWSTTVGAEINTENKLEKLNNLSDKLNSLKLCPAGDVSGTLKNCMSNMI